MDLMLTGRRALVVGGGSGLGLATARALAAEGVSVALVGRSNERLAAAVDRFAAEGLTAAAIAADISVTASLDKLVTRAETALDGAIDVLVNNCGGPPPGPVTDLSADHWRAHFDAMVVPMIKLADRCRPAMVERGWGRILNIASSAVVQPIPMLGLSNSLRSTVVGWAKTLAGEVGQAGITVNTILPGRIATDRIARLDAARAEASGRSIDAVTQEANATIPLGRAGTPEEFGAVLAFLASPLAAYITGSLIRIDGGLIRSV